MTESIIVASSRKRVHYANYMSNPKFQQQVWNSMDHNMALGLFAFLFRENRDLSGRWIRLTRDGEFTTKDSDPEMLHIHNVIRLELAPGEDGGDVE